MKRRFAVLMALALALSLCACVRNDANEMIPDDSLNTQENDQVETDDISSENDRVETDDISSENTQTETGEKLTAFEKYFRNGPFWVQDENGLYGFIDQTGNYVIDPQFNDIGDKYKPFSFGVAFVQDNENMPKLWGLIDTSGNYVVEPIFSDVGKFTADELACVQDRDSGLYGYIDPTGTYQIEPQFTEARSFVDGLAIVSSGYGYTYINTSGEIAISGGFEEANTFFDGLAAVKSWGLWGYINRSGEFVVQPIYDMVYSFSDGVAFVHEGDYANGYSLIDTEGNYILKESVYTPNSGTPNDGKNAAKWVDGLCCVRTAVDDSYPALGFGYAYINKSGEKILPKDDTYYNQTWEFVKSDSGTYAAATDHASGLYGYIDTEGNWLIPPQYQGDTSQAISPFNGIGLVDEGRVYIDMSGNVLARVEAPLSFTGGCYNTDILLAVSYDEGEYEYVYPDIKYGYVYPDGSVALDFIYDDGKGFARDGSYAVVQYEGLWGIIDMDGNWLIPAKFKAMQANYI